VPQLELRQLDGLPDDVLLAGGPAIGHIVGEWLRDA